MKFNIFLYSAIFAAISACESHSAAEKKVISSIESHKISNTTGNIDIEKFFHSKIYKICIQYPYMTQSQFEKEVGFSVDGFKMIDDRFNAIWFFFDEGEKTAVKIDRWKVMDKASGGLRCVNDKPVLNIGSAGGVLTYRILENK